MKWYDIFVGSFRNKLEKVVALSNQGMESSKIAESLNMEVSEIETILKLDKMEGEGIMEAGYDERLKKVNKFLKKLVEETAADLKDKIIFDGVDDKYIQKYMSAIPRVLWILKEAPETNGVYGWHIGSIDEKNKALKNTRGTLRQMCCISYSILNH
jgi:hypothetical protein